ncbi:sulfite exporter TauE/SafE family protein [Paenisporosarcina cavernae]|uniref:Probable membrane transporter protein n=1 Tax=Paenisporosarcina cavernae TaxID=2320858 RepID=A0A385YR72_9BACL|nr:sulfite exporter TauE/SafE family protein [Paenisporosarcina cavernae]AYC28497.1 sulfite exporter TauE/SafE family protein [Paenisporosarcina cavernae]
MEIVGFLLIIFVATLLQTITGFGFSILATPLLLFLISPADAIQVNLILSFVLSLSVWRTLKREMNRDMLKRLIIGSLPGLPIGIVLFLVVNLVVFKLIIGFVLLFVTIFVLSPVTLHPSTKRDVGVGALAGAFTTSIGMPGPPILAYVTGAKMPKEQLRATTLAFYLFIYLVSFVMQAVVSGVHLSVWNHSLLALPVLFLGVVTGQKIFKRIPATVFNRVMYSLLIVTAGMLIFDALSEF